jgi:hypothetical protein
MAAPARPTIPSGAIGIRSPGSRNASATIAAMPAAVRPIFYTAEPMNWRRC